MPCSDSTSDAVPAAPPPEVLAEIEVAARACDRLTAHGLALRFALAPSSRGLCITLVDASGAVRRRLPPSAVLDIAAGTLDPADLIRG